eukprot:TRINITY_DN104976_c0_g1_i1.p1 TRINITY_DN104976_c0_g1~~TRINITY_DN104976_c0_g1_i1.p1  ORF type:complete len:931 (+),score=115.19 TRINITY_DN104976_c0_g1_i1:34-2793(+)
MPGATSSNYFGFATDESSDPNANARTQEIPLRVQSKTKDNCSITFIIATTIRYLKPPTKTTSTQLQQHATSAIRSEVSQLVLADATKDKDWIIRNVQAELNSQAAQLGFNVVQMTLVDMLEQSNFNDHSSSSPNTNSKQPKDNRPQEAAIAKLLALQQTGAIVTQSDHLKNMNPNNPNGPPPGGPHQHGPHNFQNGAPHHQHMHHQPPPSPPHQQMSQYHTQHHPPGHPAMMMMGPHHHHMMQHGGRGRGPMGHQHGYMQQPGMYQQAQSQWVQQHAHHQHNNHNAPPSTPPHGLAHQRGHTRNPPSTPGTPNTGTSSSSSQQTSNKDPQSTTKEKEEDTSDDTWPPVVHATPVLQPWQMRFQAQAKPNSANNSPSLTSVTTWPPAAPSASGLPPTNSASGLMSTPPRLHLDGSSSTGSPTLSGGSPCTTPSADPNSSTMLSLLSGNRHLVEHHHHHSSHEPSLSSSVADSAAFAGMLTTQLFNTYSMMNGMEIEQVNSSLIIPSDLFHDQYYFYEKTRRETEARKTQPHPQDEHDTSVDCTEPISSTSDSLATPLDNLPVTAQPNPNVKMPALIRAPKVTLFVPSDRDPHGAAQAVSSPSTSSTSTQSQTTSQQVAPYPTVSMETVKDVYTTIEKGMDRLLRITTLKVHIHSPKTSQAAIDDARQKLQRESECVMLCLGLATLEEDPMTGATTPVIQELNRDSNQSPSSKGDDKSYIRQLFKVPKGIKLLAKALAALSGECTAVITNDVLSNWHTLATVVKQDKTKQSQSSPSVWSTAVTTLATNCCAAIAEMDHNHVTCILTTVIDSNDLDDILAILNNHYGLQIITALLQRGAKQKEAGEASDQWQAVFSRLYNNLIDSFIALADDFATCTDAEVKNGAELAAQFFESMHVNCSPSQRQLLKEELQESELTVPAHW